MDVQQKTVSLVVPFFNEGASIQSFHASIMRVIDGLPSINFAIVCVDDGSSDDTLAQLIGLNRIDARFQVLELSRNFGKEAALTAGIDFAGGDALIPIDADLQDPPELVALLIEQWQKGADVVLARRVDRSSDSILKRLTAKLFYRFHNMVSKPSIPLDVGDFRLMNRAVVEALKKLPERQRFMKGLFAWVGFKTVTVDYKRNPRQTGTTKFNGWKLWNLALEGITSFSVIPLKVWTYLGLFISLLTFIYAVVIVVKTMLYGIDVPGYASLIVAILFMGSLQLIGIGVLGEYIGRIYMETKQRPIYMIRERYGI